MLVEFILVFICYTPFASDVGMTSYNSNSDCESKTLTDCGSGEVGLGYGLSGACPVHVSLLVEGDILGLSLATVPAESLSVASVALPLGANPDVRYI